MSFNWVDLILFLVILFSALGGWQRGFILSLLDLVRWLGSWLLALIFYRPLSEWLSYVVDWTETWRHPAAFIFIVVTASIAIHVIGHLILRRVPLETHLRPVNRLLGILPGIVNGVVLAGVLSALLYAVPITEGLSDAAQHSWLAEKFAVYTDEFEDALTPIFRPALNQTLTRLITVEPGSEESVELPFKVENSKPDPSLESQMLELINEERTSRGLKPLAPDAELVPVARAHSADMYARGYFSHYTPEGEDPFQRMKDAGIKFQTAGENLALAPTLQIAHTGLMNSPGHRANILNPAFGRVGIGIMSGGRRGIMVSQEFRN
ncbi:MAG TPA: CvpA family protein [Pyrinomonadaceae bacterium]|nr:CvpA family protein [Pyrinomonadaceae bacterium]